MADIYYNNASPQQFDWKNAQGNVQGTTGNPELDQKLAGLRPEERIKIQQQAQEPLTGEEVALAMKQDVDFTPTKTEYQQYLGFHKTEHHSIFEGIGAGASAILHDFANAGNALIDHPISALGKAPASLLEAFMQGSRNLYGMVAQSQDPTSSLFKLKDALAGSGSDAGYQQFLDARKFNKYSSQLADGSETMVVDKDFIDHDLTLAMSYIADPTLFVPYLGQVSGATKAISAGMRATAMGERIANIYGKVGVIKAGIIGGTLKYAVGAPLEMVGGTIRGTIDATAKAGASILETATGIGAAEAKSTLRGVGVTSTAASFAGHGIPVVSDISNVYLGANAARGAGEAISAIGNQIIAQGGKRGFNSFAAQAMIDTEKAGIQLSGQAKGLLRVINAVDPIFSYGASAANGITHGAMIGGTLGYLSGGEEGAYHGIGAGMALGGIGAVGGKMFSDVSGGTKWQRAEIAGGFALDVMKTENPTNHKGWSLILESAKTPEQRRVVLQAIAGIDNIAGDHSLFVGDKAAFEASVKSQGYDLDGRHIDPKTGEATIGKDGKPVERIATANEFHGTEGFVVTKADGKIGIHINLEKWANNKSADAFPHEIFHAVMRQTDMYKQFLGGWTEHLLGKFGADGTKLESAKVDPKEFMEFQKRYIDRLPISDADKAYKVKLTELAHKEFQLAGGDLAKMHEANPEAAAHLKYQSEEFGAYYYTQWIKGKPLDYLFYGGKLPTIRGALDSMGNKWVDFWANKVNKEAPSFNFNAKDANGNRVGLDAAFSGNGEGRVRVPAMDLMLQDLIRAQSGQKSKNAVTVGAMTPTGRLNWIKNNGVDGMIHAIDPQTGAWLGINKAKYVEWQTQNAKDVVSALNQLNGKSEDSYTGNRTDAELKHLVEQGVWTQAFADRIKSFQEAIANPDASNLYHHDYHGDSQETGVGTSRLRGDEVPVTNRSTIPVKLDLNFHKDGTYAANLHSVDMKVMNERVNTEWSKPEVRALWGDNHGDMMDDFIKYINNGAKDKDARIESALLLEDGRGNGAQIRDIFHQMLGFAKSEKVDYFNPAIKDIVREKFGTFQTLKVDLMSPLSHDASAPRLNVSQDSFRLLSRNFKVSDMAEESTPNGVVYTHESGYKIIYEDKTANTKAYDSEGKLIGIYKNNKQAEVAATAHYEAQQAKTPKQEADAAKAQDKVQKTFKILSEEDKAQAVERKDVFLTDKMQEFSHGTEVIKQTREEFYNEHFLKLRQSDPATVLAVTEDVLSRADVVRKQKDSVKVQMDAAEKGGSKTRDSFWKLREEYQRLERISRADDLQRVYDRAKTSGADIGQAVLDYINTSRKNGLRYDEMAKIFFGRSFDAQTTTGKPVTVVATHGTNSPQLLLDMHFDPNKLGVGGRHGSAADGIGAFLSGEIKTSRGYGISADEFNYRQVRVATRFDNPLVIDGEFQNYTPKKYEAYIKAAVEGGHDGMIVQNIYDGGSADTVYVPFKKGIADKTVILDSIDENSWKDSASWDARAADKAYPFGESTDAAYPVTKKEPLPRGVKTMRDFTGSWKVGDEGAPKPLTNSEKQALRIVRTTLPMSMPDIWDMLIKSGNVIKNFDWRQIRGPVIISNPDTMIAGSVSMGKTPILKEVKGGPNFSAAKQGEAWAVASKSKQTEYVNSLNDAYRAKLKEVELLGKRKGWSENKLKQELADVSVHMILTRGSNAKVLNNTQGAFGAMTLLKDFVKKGVLTEQGLRDALQKASQHTYIDSETKVVTRTFPTLDYTGTENVKLTKLLSDKFFDSEDTSTFGTRGTFVGEVIGEIAKNNKEFKSKENLAKLKEVFSNPEFKLSKEALLSEIGKSFSEPYTDNIPMHHAFASVEINGLVEGAESTHPAYPHGIRKVGGGQVKLNLFSDTVAIRDMVNHPTAGDLSTTPLAENKLGSNSKGIARAVMKSSSEHAIKPAGEGRIGMNYKVDDIAGAPREGGAKTYTEGNAEWKSQFVGRIAEQNPDKIKGLQIKYIENKTLFKDKNLVTVVLHNDKGQQVGILNADVYKDGTAKIVDTGVPEQFGNRGYSKLMLSELGERIRSQGVKEVYGEVVDKLDRPTKARKSVWGNAELDPDSISNISESGHNTVSKLNTDAHYKVSDEQMSSDFIGRVAKENPNITKGIRVEFEKTRSSKFGDEYILRLFKKDKADGGEEIMIGTFNSEVDGNSASSGNAEIKGDFRNKGYGRLMYSEMAERLRALGAESWGGRMVDQARRPQILRERVIDQENARLGYQDSETRLSDERQDYNGDKTFYIESTLRKEAHYKVSDSDIAQVREKMDYLQSLMDKNEKYKNGGRGYSDQKRRYWDAKQEYNKLNEYTLKPMLAEMQKQTSEGTPNLKPFEGKFKVSEPVRKGINKIDSLIAEETDKSNLSPNVKNGFAQFKEAIRKQDATDEVLIPEVRQSYDALRDNVNRELSNGLTLTPAPVLKSILKALDGIDKKLSKDASRIAGKINAGDMAEGASIEAAQSDEQTAKIGAYRADQNEGADVESHTTQQADLQEGADIEAEGMPKPSAPNPAFPYPAPKTPAIPKPAPAVAKPAPAVNQAAIDASKKAEFDKYQALKDKVAARNNPPAPAPVTPTQPAPVAPVSPAGTTPVPPNTQRLWRGYTTETSTNGTVLKNAIGWIIMNQGDKFKVYNPQQALQGIYNDLESAKRRVQRAEPKQ